MFARESLFGVLLCLHAIMRQINLVLFFYEAYNGLRIRISTNIRIKLIEYVLNN